MVRGQSAKRLSMLAYGAWSVFFWPWLGCRLEYLGNDFKVTTAQMKIREIAQACQHYYMEHNGQYPANLEELVNKDEAARGVLNSRPSWTPGGQPYHYD